MDLKAKIRVIDDFPEKGISFKDITTLLADKEAYPYVVDQFINYLKDKNVDMIMGPEARGFLFGAAVAYGLGIGFVPVRKPGKLPATTARNDYDLEYGKDALEIHKDALYPGMRVAIVDDLLATGGTMRATAELAEMQGAKVVALGFLIELLDLKGRDKLAGHDILSLVKYEH